MSAWHRRRVVFAELVHQGDEIVGLFVCCERRGCPPAEVEVDDMIAIAGIIESGIPCPQILGEIMVEHQ